jgi:glucans biosynthesis protein C
MSGVARPPRLVYVDQLRVLALLGVFVVHVCSPFDPWDRWHVTSPDRSRVLGEIVVLMAPWLMPLVMLLAGVSAWYSLAHRANGAYLRERALRVLLPFAAGMVLLVPPQVWIERRMHGQFAGSLWAFYPHFVDGLYPRGNFSWHHLWFLAHLFAYAVVTLPLFRFLQGERGRALLRRLARLCSGPGGLLWLSLPLVVERHLLSPLLTGDRVLATDWSNRGLLPMAYVYGFVLAGEHWLGEDIDREWRRALAGAALCTAALALAAWHGLIPSRVPPPFTVGYLVVWTIYAFGAWSWLVALLGIGRRWLRTESRFFAYGAETGAAWYLVHQPVIVAVAALVVGWKAPLAVRAAALLVLSFAATLALVEALRRLPVVRALFGFQRGRGGDRVG